MYGIQYGAGCVWPWNTVWGRVSLEYSMGQGVYEYSMGRVSMNTVWCRVSMEYSMGQDV